MEKSLSKKIIYVLIPFLLIGVFGLILFLSKAWRMEGYSFLSDYTNCFMLGYIFFFMYFVHGLFLPYFHRQVKSLGFKVNPSVHTKYSININFAYCTVSICSVLISAFAIPFIYTACKTGDVNWYSKLNNVELVYYSFLIVLAWIMTARLFASILIDAVAVYKYLQHGLMHLDYYNIDKKCGLKGLYTSLSASMGFGCYFLIAVAVIIYSDYNAYDQYGLDLLAHEYCWIIIIITMILSVIYFSIVIITYISLNKIMKASIQKKTMEVKICKKKIALFARNFFLDCDVARFLRVLVICFISWYCCYYSNFYINIGCKILKLLIFA